MADGAVEGSPRRILRLEGAAVLVAAVTAYAALIGLQPRWWAAWVVLFFVPDLAILAYRRGPAFGAAAYNLVHSYVLPLLVAIVSPMLGYADGMAIALIWIAHIGFDRMLGYGLKYPDGFQHTHIGRTGRPAPEVP